MPIKAGPTPASLNELKAVILATKVMDKELRKSINQATREQGNELFRGLLQMNATTTMDMRMLAKGARVAAGNPPRLIAAASKRKALSGGMIPDRYGKTAEFGVKDREAVSTYERKSKAGGFMVTCTWPCASRSMCTRPARSSVAPAVAASMAPTMAT